MYDFKQIVPSEADWAAIEASPDSTVFHSRQWNEFMGKAGFKVVVVDVGREGTHIGYFLAEELKYLFKLWCAPTEGTGTYTQGLCLAVPVPEDERIRIYGELAKWVFEKNLASYIQIDDWQLRRDSVEQLELDTWHHEGLDAAGVKYSVRPTLHVNLHRPEDELWSGLHYKSCKYCVNKARKLGLSVRFVDKFEDIPDFTQIHYAQLVDVCDRHGIYPKKSQRESRMRQLCESLFPNRVLMAEVVGPDETGAEQVMSTGIFAYDKGECIYWTGASFRQYQKYCPNELMVWEAMRELGSRGAGNLNFGGQGTYKLKFGTQYAYVPKMYFYKYGIIYGVKQLAWREYHRFREFVTWIKTGFGLKK